MSATTAINSRTWRARPRPPWASRRSMSWPTAATSRARRFWPATLGVTPYVPKPLTSGAKAEGRFGKQDFVYIAEDGVYRCPAHERLTRRFTSVEHGMTLHTYWTTKCGDCALKAQCTTGKQRRIKRWEHEAVIDAMQQRLDRTPKAM